MLVVFHKCVPFAVFGHGNDTATKPVDRIICFIRLSFKDAGKGVIGLLDLANYNRLQFTAGALQIKEGLANNISQRLPYFRHDAYPVQIILFFNLAFELSVNSELDYIWITLAVRCVRICISNCQSLL